MPIERTGMAPRILCVVSNPAILESRCEALKASGYDASSATPQVAESVLLSQKFDLIVVSGLSGPDLQRVNNLAEGADMVVLSGLTLPSEMLFSVGQLLDRQESA
jgi:DNA-binding response OmpR family regulator